MLSDMSYTAVSALTAKHCLVISECQRTGKHWKPLDTRSIVQKAVEQHKASKQGARVPASPAAARQAMCEVCTCPWPRGDPHRER